MLAESDAPDRCPVCEAPLPRITPGGLCPACLVRGLFGESQDIEEDSADREEARIGSYHLIRIAGEGGFGVVYRAERGDAVRHPVALKILKPARDDAPARRRFEREAQLLCALQHPNIATFYESGNLPDGRSYIALEWIEGQPITGYCDARTLRPSQRLRLFAEVCRAIHHAHQRGVVHRDLKPGNILVAERDGMPVPKIIDFGIARLLTGRPGAEAAETAQGHGTPQYMSPEQSGDCPEDVDIRSDVYSLGVLLYELLTGTTPLRTEEIATASPIEVRRQIRETDPPLPSTRVSSLGAALPAVAGQRGASPSTLRRSLRGDLDWIVMKALEKDRNRRYHCADSLAEDIDHYLRDEPVAAGPPTAWYVARKFIRRHWAGAWAAAACVVLLGAGAILGAAAWLHTKSVHERLALLTPEMQSRRAESEARRDAAERLNRALVATLDGRLRRAGRSSVLKAVIGRYTARGAAWEVSSGDRLSDAVGLAGSAVALQDGDLDAARTQIEAVHRFRKAAFSRHPSPAGAAALAEALYFRGLILDDQGETRAARRCLEEAEAVLAKHWPEPKAAPIAIDRALALAEGARVALDDGDIAGAERLIETGERLLESSAEEHPDHGQARAALLQRGAVVALLQGDAAAGFSAASEAVRLLSAPGSPDMPSAGRLHELALALALRARATAESAVLSYDLEPALEDLLQAEGILNELTERPASPLSWRAELIELRRLLSGLLGQAGRLPEAAAVVERGLRALEPYPSHPIWLGRWRILNAELLGCRARIADAVGEPEAGQNDARNGLAELSVSVGRPRERRRALGVAASLHAYLGETQLRAGASGEALDSYRSALAAIQDGKREFATGPVESGPEARIRLGFAAAAEACDRIDEAFVEAEEVLRLTAPGLCGPPHTTFWLASASSAGRGG
ncbi:MAG TPA: serine/threonine-protein kinase [Verrucomicrobiales bacterium]|nr:serine/threonine-protein kinase [Verrucomicrobiales bacterium]